jgi:hypothetical protein
LLFGVIGEHQQSGLAILVLPCLKETIRSRQSRNVRPIILSACSHSIRMSVSPARE